MPELPDRLLTRLAAALPDLDPRTLADAIWLAATATTWRDSNTEREPDVGGPTPTSTDPPTTATTPTPSAEQDQPVSDVDLLLQTSGSTDLVSGRSVELRRARPISNELALVRALRPFTRRLFEGDHRQLDIDATVEHYARSLSLIPIFSATPERWFDVVVVIDRSLSMAVWAETAAAFARLLAGTGAFRSVDTAELTWAADTPQIHQHGRRLLAGRLRTISSPARRLVLVISDCAASGWWQDPIWQTLSEWGRSAPTALLDPLPMRLWRRSGLDLPPVQATGVSIGGRNTTLAYRLPIRLRTAGGEPRSWLPLPAVAFTPASLGRWARTLMRGEPGGCDAVLIPEAGRRLLGRARNMNRSASDPAKLAEAFMATAPSAAVRLATFCSPFRQVNLSFLHTMCEQLVPEAGLADIAELLLSGLFTAHVNETKEPTLVFDDRARATISEHLTMHDDRRSFQVFSRYAASPLPSHWAMPVLARDPAAARRFAAEPRPFAAAANASDGASWAQIAAVIDSEILGRDDRTSARMTSNAELRELCLSLRAKQITTDNDLAIRIETDVREYRTAFQRETAAPAPPAYLVGNLWLTGWLMYETTWEALQRTPASIRLEHNPEREAVEATTSLVDRIADASRYLPWPEFAPRALGAIRSQALVESKLDTEEGYDAAWILLNEARQKHASFIDSHQGQPGREPYLLGLNEALLQLALAELGTAHRSAERTIVKWADRVEFEAPSIRTHDEDRWIQRMFRDLHAAVEMGEKAIRTARSIQQEYGFAAQVDEYRLTLPTALYNPAVMTARAILLMLAMQPAMEQLGRSPTGGHLSWLQARDDLLSRFVEAYRIVEEPIAIDSSTATRSSDSIRLMVEMRLTLALIAPGFSLPATNPSEACLAIDPLDVDAVEELSSWLNRSRFRGNILASATMPAFIRSVITCQVGSGINYREWRNRYNGLDGYVGESRRQESVDAAFKDL